MNQKINYIVGYFYKTLKKEKYPDSFDKLLFKYDVIIHYLTWRCNSRCITCNCWKTPIREKKKEIWNTVNIRKFYATVKVKEVYLTGGEPTLIPNFKEIVKEIHKISGATISFTTNSLATEKIKKDVLSLKESSVPFLVSLSCNGFEKIHDFSRGVKGNYKKVLHLIDFFKNNKISFYLLYTLFPFNINETIKFVKYWKERNINVCIGIGRTDERYKINTSYKKYVIFNKKDYLLMEKVLLNLSNIFPEYKPQYYLIKRINEKSRHFPCFGLSNRLVISPYGEVYPCDGLPKTLYLGNLKDVTFDFNQFVKVNKTKLENVYNIIKNKKCQPCMYVCDLLEGISRSLSRRDKLKIASSLVTRKIRKAIKLKIRNIKLLPLF